MLVLSMILPMPVSSFIMVVACTLIQGVCVFLSFVALRYFLLYDPNPNCHIETLREGERIRALFVCVLVSPLVLSPSSMFLYDS